MRTDDEDTVCNSGPFYKASAGPALRSNKAQLLKTQAVADLDGMDADATWDHGRSVNALPARARIATQQNLPQRGASLRVRRATGTTWVDASIRDAHRAWTAALLA
ncbi:MAG: hypothetical protein ACUVVU_05565 [Tepidimonas sp.]